MPYNTLNGEKGDIMKYQFTAQAARWFDKVNGNTYHSVHVTNNETGESLFCPFQYGYGEQYRETALHEMSSKGWLPEKYTGADKAGAKYWFYERENDYPINWIVTDGLKRDCIHNGQG